jgi:hypothetical protein
MEKNNKEKIKFNLNEGFDGIRKDNSRFIFGILLSFIIIDLIYALFI